MTNPACSSSVLIGSSRANDKIRFLDLNWVRKGACLVCYFQFCVPIVQKQPRVSELPSSFFSVSNQEVYIAECALHPVHNHWVLYWFWLEPNSIPNSIPSSIPSSNSFQIFCPGRNQAHFQVMILVLNRVLSQVLPIIFSKSMCCS